MKEKLELSALKSNLNLNINTLQLHPIYKLVDSSYKTTIDFDVYLPSKKMNLQRDFVWTLEQKQSLILSFFKGIKIPKLSIIQYQDDSNSNNIVTILKIIDGKQRLSTFLSFYNNEFPIVINNIEYYISDLSDEMKTTFELYKFDIDIVYEYFDALISDEEKINWFGMINWFGTKQDIEHENKLKLL